MNDLKEVRAGLEDLGNQIEQLAPELRQPSPELG